MRIKKKDLELQKLKSLIGQAPDEKALMLVHEGNTIYGQIQTRAQAGTGVIAMLNIEASTTTDSPESLYVNAETLYNLLQKIEPEGWVDISVSEISFNDGKSSYKIPQEEFGFDKFQVGEDVNSTFKVDYAALESISHYVEQEGADADRRDCISILPANGVFGDEITKTYMATNKNLEFMLTPCIGDDIDTQCFLPAPLVKYIVTNKLVVQVSEFEDYFLLEELESKTIRIVFAKRSYSIENPTEEEIQPKYQHSVNFFFEKDKLENALARLFNVTDKSLLNEVELRWERIDSLVANFQMVIASSGTVTKSVERITVDSPMKDELATFQPRKVKGDFLMRAIKETTGNKVTVYLNDEPGDAFKITSEGCESFIIILTNR